MTEKLASSSLKPRAQQAAWEKLVTLSSALPQGLILVGPSGVGKRRAARALFQLLSCSARQGGTTEDSGSLFNAPEPTATADLASEPCGQCVSCRKVAENRHADLIEISPKGETIPVDDLREMKKSLFFPPMEGNVRFVIIDEAHKLNASSANTLLKTLEEPPAHTRFFLITHERGLLLPTIISRCQFVHFAPLDEVTLRELMVERGIEIPEGLMKVCLSLLAGGLDRAMMLSNEKTLAFIESVQRTLVRPSGSWDEITKLADSLVAASAEGSDDWRLELLLDLLVLAGHRTALLGRNLPESFTGAVRALEAAALRQRLGRYANKKLVALAAAELATRQ